MPRSEVDYSRPTHNECQCGKTHFPVDVRLCSMCGTHTLVPVFRRIPEGKRPEAEEPDGETYCVTGGARGILVVRRGRAFFLDDSCIAEGVLPCE